MRAVGSVEVESCADPGAGARRGSKVSLVSLGISRAGAKPLREFGAVVLGFIGAQTEVKPLREFGVAVLGFIGAQSEVKPLHEFGVTVPGLLECSRK